MDIAAFASTGQTVGTPADVKNLIETIMWPLNVLAKITDWDKARGLYTALGKLIQSDPFLEAVSEIIDIFKNNPEAVPSPPMFTAEVSQQFMSSGVWQQVAEWCAAHGYTLAKIPSWLMMIFSMIDWKKVLELLSKFFDKPVQPVIPTPTPVTPPVVPTPVTPTPVTPAPTDPPLVLPPVGNG